MDENWLEIQLFIHPFRAGQNVRAFPQGSTDMAENQTSNEFRSLAVSPADAAVLVGIGRTKLYQAMNAGVLPSFKIGARRLVRVAEIEAWLQRLEIAARRGGTSS